MTNVQKEIDRRKLDDKLPSMPWFVQQFMDYKLPDLSPSTLLEYLRDYEAFFGWLRAEGLSEASSNKEVTLNELKSFAWIRLPPIGYFSQPNGKEPIPELPYLANSLPFVPFSII